MKNRITFTKQFKINAVKLVTEQGCKLSEAARNLGIDSSVLRRWKTQLEADGSEAFPGKGHMTSEKEELARLHKENKRLRMERDILKKPRPSLPKSSSKISICPAATEGLSHNRTVSGDGSKSERILPIFENSS